MAKRNKEEEQEEKRGGGGERKPLVNIQRKLKQDDVFLFEK
jgi:hypothetical protein